MTDLPILFVAGLGRCGTTMAMTMLDAGGFPVAGPRPAYEMPERWTHGRPDLPWLRRCGGIGVKWIDPTRFAMRNVLPVPPVMVLMERGAREQARSQVKMVAYVATRMGRNGVKAMERSIRRDMPIVRARLGGTGTVYRMSFEDVLENPFWAARKLGRIVGGHFGHDFDEDAAMRVVIPRHPSCAPDFAMENIILPQIAAGIEARRLKSLRSATSP